MFNNFFSKQYEGQNLSIKSFITNLCKKFPVSFGWVSFTLQWTFIVFILSLNFESFCKNENHRQDG